MSDSVEFKAGDVVQLKSGGPAMTLGRAVSNAVEGPPPYTLHYSEISTKVDPDSGLSNYVFGRIYESMLPLSALKPYTCLLQTPRVVGDPTLIDAGSQVRLNSGSAKMTVTKVLKGLDNTSDVEVSWFSGNSPCEQFATVPLTSITLVG